MNTQYVHLDHHWHFAFQFLGDFIKALAEQLASDSSSCQPGAVDKLFPPTLSLFLCFSLSGGVFVLTCSDIA